MDVLVAVGHAWEARLVAQLSAVRGVSVSRRCVDLAELLSAVAAGHGDVAIVSGDVRGLDRESVAQVARSGARVVGAMPDASEEHERELRQLGIQAVIHPGLQPDEIRERLEDGTSALSADGLIGDEEESSEGRERPPASRHQEHLVDREEGADASAEEADGAARESVVIAVWGPTGAPGRTTLAVNIASEAAALGKETLLIDLDTYGASAAQSLSVLDESPGVAAAARASELGTLDLAALGRLAPEVSPGLRLLSGIVSPGRWPELRVAAVEHVLALSRTLAQVVVLDLGFSVEDDEELSYDTDAPRRNATTIVGLAAADELVVVGSGDPIGLQRLVRSLQALAAIPSPAPRTVVNRVRAGAVGSDPGRRIAESLERFAGVGDLALVPDDPTACDAALLQGRTLAECAPSSPAREAVRLLTADLVGAELPRRENPRGRRRRR